MSCNWNSATRFTVCTTFNTVNALKDRPTLNYGLSCTRGHRLNLNHQLYCLMLLTTVHSLMTNCILWFTKSLLLGRLRNTSGQLFRLTVCRLYWGSSQVKVNNLLITELKLKLDHTLLYRYNSPPPIRGWRPKRSNSYCLNPKRISEDMAPQPAWALY